MRAPLEEDETGLPEQLRVRRAKRDRLLDSGTEAYPVRLERSHTLGEVRAAFEGGVAGAGTGRVVAIAGRIVALRDGGRVMFATLREGSGAELQIMLAADRLGEELRSDWKRLVDLGDLIGATGEVITTARGELTVAVEDWRMAAKALRPLPVAHRPMSEESRVRRRYLDLIMRPEAGEVVRIRSEALRTLRESFHRRDFLEVETPMLQTVPGGASARPFQTHSNAFDCDLYLRIAPELFLKRCVVGGLERVFEINRNFRNEGSDSSHSPEFCALESYQAFADYRDMARLTRELVQETVRAVTGGEVVRHPDGTEVEFGGAWTEISLHGSLSEALGEEITPETSVERLLKHAERLGVAPPAEATSGRLVEDLFEAVVVPGLTAPTFVFDFPEETSPLARQHRSVPGLAEKWDLYVLGFELATAYSELVDPVIQRERLMAQAAAGGRGDDEAMRLDEEFLTALEHGMPPTGGMGMGFDRLLMAITGLGIRETVLFPLVRRERR
ncbi:lysine--tRNA ligase [Actinocorallia sp. API 0066]|uniref:lysine--tRNA ligase n=1 Tax=Actinocorallia sp. API 0066 TaxID=2896846 RepID=UPI001E39E504|nr:lysine--tRNA ligase [Actinocorallia sp. API 0066]MCD0448019.1 lysine--tRNA ligase [Actinocorallia sp. API 0066]